jgi:N-acetylneuraminic acid mutarotase
MAKGASVVRPVHRFRFPRVNLRFAGVMLLAAAGIATVRTATQRIELPNFDIRTEKTPEAAAYVSRFAAPPAFAGSAAARATSLADLEQSVARLETVVNPETGVLEVVGTEPGSGFLTGPSADRVGTLRSFLATYAPAYGLTREQVVNLDVVADYMNPAGNMGWVEFEQRINGYRVFRGLLRGGFTADGRLVRTTGPLAAGLDPATLATAPSLSATQAVSRAADSVGSTAALSGLVTTSDIDGRVTFASGTMATAARAWLVYFPLSPGIARLAWVTEVWGDPDVFMIALDADDGTVLFRKNLTNYQTQPATYVVYNDDSPAPMSPSTTLPGMGVQASLIGRTLFSLIGNEGPFSFNTLGWMTDGSNVTDGNAVQAGVDLAGPDGVDAPTTGVARVFDFAYNPAPGVPPPGDSPTLAAFRDGEVTHGFYWTNRYHDELYLLGFTEAARNFQNDNFGRGGLGADRISAEFQDSSGVANANFSTPADGLRGRMQMYIFNGPTPNRTSGLDNDVLIHELTHGTSNRLHNNAAGLTTTMSAGMGEGWSDFYARSLLSSAGEDPNAIYSTGGWVTYQAAAGYTDNYYYGIRRFPYAVRTNVGANGRPHNPLTFADIDPVQVNLTDGAFPRGPFGSGTAFQVHNIGEVWASALFEVRARFIARLGYAVGQQRFLQIVTDGMKLDPVNPTLLQGRDSILAAASAASFSSAADLFADTQDVWAGFATRGMGYSAQVINVTLGTVVEAFDLPGIAANGGTVIAESIPNGRLDPGESATVSLCIINLAASASGSVSGNLQATGGVLSPSGTQVFGLVPSQTSICRTYTLIVGASCGGTMTATLQAQEAGGVTRNLTYNFPIGAVTAEGFDTVTTPALPAGWTTATLSGTANLWATGLTGADTPPNRAFTANPGTISDNVLVSSVMSVPATNSVLTFRNFYNTENTFDGGVLEISIAGGAFADIITAGGSFVAGGYNGTLNASFGNPIGGRQAWTGNAGAFITTSVNLPVAANGQNIQLRWRIGTDNIVAAAGWSIDTVVLTTTCANQAPVITTQPISQTVTSGTSVGLSVYAAGTAPLSYQWYIGASGDTSNPVAGATASSYLTPPLAIPTAYWVRVTNPVGSTNSATATLTIGPGAGAEMVANGDFSQPFPSGWAVFEEPDIIYSVVGGVFQYHRANPTTTPSGQAVVFQNTGFPVAANAALRATFDIGNSSTARKRISVLIIDSNFSDLSVCTFWLAPGAPLATYTMRTRTTRPWANAAIYFYAATKGADGGEYLLDNVSLTTQPSLTTSRTDCVDPFMPTPLGGAPGPNLIVNGDFSTGAASPWATFGVINSQVAGGVMEFIRPAPAPAQPAGTVFQATGQAMTANQFLTTTFQLGNSSAVRKRVTVLMVSEGAFSDLAACTFWLTPGQPLQTYTMLSRTTQAWTDATLYFYAATVGNETWIRLDNVTLTRTPATPMLGTECIEPGEPAAGTWSSAPPYPITILDQATTTVGGNLYSFGGVSTATIATSYRFDGAAWTGIAALPQALEFPAAVTDGTNAYVLGGASTAGTPQTTLYRYNVATNNYTTLAPFTVGTWNHAAVYLNGKIYKFGGTGPATASTNALEIYDVGTNTWASGAVYPLSASFISAWAYNNFIYAAGGLQTVGSVPTLKTYRYDPVANTWDDAAIADLPVTRWGAATAFLNGRAVLAGGYVNGNVTGSISTSVASWNPANNTWGNGPDLLAERSRMTGAVLNGAFYVVGGRSFASHLFVGTNSNQRLGTGSPFGDSYPLEPGGSPGPDTIDAWAPVVGGAGGAAMAARAPGVTLKEGESGSSGDASGSSGDAPDGPRWEARSRGAGLEVLYWGRPIDLTDAASAHLTFRSALSGRSTGEIQVTADGSSWRTITVVPDGSGWTSADLTAFSGRVVYVRFVFRTLEDRGLASDAWTIGDVLINVRR